MRFVQVIAEADDVARRIVNEANKLLNKICFMEKFLRITYLNDITFVVRYSVHSTKPENYTYFQYSKLFGYCTRQSEK